MTMARTTAVALMLGAGLAALPAAGATGCPPAGYSRAQLRALAAADFEIADPAARARLARGLTACLAAPDPWLRDGVAFTALAHMLRGNQLDAGTQSALVDDLMPRLASRDPRGFEQPFAALALSELVRAERLSPYLAENRRAALLERSIAWFRGIHDYRGFSDREGWRHAVAHGADLLLQWTLHPRTGRAELLQIRDAIGARIAPPDHAYVHGESERLARPILVIARSGVSTADEWQSWLMQLVPAERNLFASERGLALRHDLLAFLQSAYVAATLDADAQDDVLIPGLEAALKALP